jgi:adenylate kinase
MNLILLGPPGAGKGTQAKLIKDKYNIPHISTGDIFRKNIAEETPLGKLAKEYMDKGDLVPDILTTKIVQQRLKEDDCRNGFLLDGFPRTVSQAEALESIAREVGLQIDRVLFVTVPNEVIVERNSGRRICSNCGSTFHTRFKPSKLKDKCEHCLGQLIQREDDTPAALTKRLDVYKIQTNPLITYYKHKGLLSMIDGTNSAEVVFNNIVMTLECSMSLEQGV